MALGVFVTNAGEGAWYTSWALYFTTVVGLSPAAVGLGLLVAGGVAVAGATPVGALADRYSPRTVLAVLVAVDGLSMAAYVTVREFWWFLAIAVVNTLVDRAAVGVKTAYVAGLVSTVDRMPELARQRVASHVGSTIGAAAGAICLAIGTPAAFMVLILVNAATSLCYAAIIARLPSVRTSAHKNSEPFRLDGPFLVLMAITTVLSLCWGMVSTALPLWLHQNTQLPTALAAVVVVVNSLGIATLQVVASRGCDSVAGAARRALAAGIFLAVACVLLALTKGGSGYVAVVVIFAAAACHLVGELFYIAARWGLTLNLAPPGATGRYQGMAGSAEAGAQMMSPAIMTTLIASWGQNGWYVLAAGFLLAGVLVPATARYVQRARFPAEVAG
jgi:MFS family permease